MIKLLANAEAIVWDFDNLFYEYTEPFYELCDHVNALAACNVIPNMDYKTALDLSIESYKNYGDCVTGFVPLAKDLNIPEKQFKENLFFEYHEILFEKTSQDHPTLLTVPKTVVEKFGKLEGKTSNIILSHSAIDAWLKPALATMQLDRFFNEDRIIGSEHFDFKSKNESPAGITLAVERLKVHPSKIVFIEDTLKNLQVAKKTYPAMTTVFKTNKTEKPEGVDILVKSQEDFLDKVIEAKTEINLKPNSQRLSLNGR